MLTNLNFLGTGQPWPPNNQEERHRLRRYADNKLLFEGRHELVFKEVFTRLFRRDPAMKMSVEMCLNWPKRLTTLWADLLAGETPVVEDGTEGAEYLTDLTQRVNLWHKVYTAAIDASRYGNAVFKVRRDEDGVRLDVIPPSCWFPVVSPTDSKKITAHVLAWPTGEVDEGTGQLHVEIHTAGRVEYRVYERSNKLLIAPFDMNRSELGGVGKLLEQSEEVTGINRPLVVAVSNLELSDAVYGLDDYGDLTSVIQELEVRFAQLARILDRHADPIMYGPDDTSTDENGNKVANIGTYVPVMDGDAPPGYVTWDAQTASCFQQIDSLMEQFYILSETSPAVFGNTKNGLAESGSALKRLLMAPLAKVNRTRANFDTAVKEVLKLAALMDSGADVDPVIQWKDGLPDDPAEAVQTENVAVAAGITSKQTAMRRVYGYSEEQAKAELALIEEETPPLADPTTLTDPAYDDLKKDDGGGGD